MPRKLESKRPNQIGLAEAKSPAPYFGQYLSRSSRFNNFPVGVRGSSGENSIRAGHFSFDSLAWQ